MLFINPEINTGITLSSVASIWKFMIPFAAIFAMSVGAFVRHSHYSKAFKMTYYLVQMLNVFLAGYYVYAIKSQHLG